MARKSQVEIQRLSELLKRDHTLYGGVLLGLAGFVVELQARAVKVNESDCKMSWPDAVSVTGMARGSLLECMSRIAGAFAKYNIPMPEVNILVNLAPADLVKEGTWLDLPLAIIILQAAGYLPDLSEVAESKYILVGEVGLHGEIRRVPGILSIAKETVPGQSLIVPTGNEKECALIMAAPGHEGCRVSAVSNIMEVIEFFNGRKTLENIIARGVKFEKLFKDATNIGTIRGQSRAKEAALIAAAGGHNLLMVGPPGEGKSLLASAIPGLLPPLANEELVELTRIYSAFGALEEDGVIVNHRPMRSIHHTATKQSIIGGGSKIAKPGEITLSHLGVLFLDELGEFSAATLDSLRQPMESGIVRISRVGASVEFPSRFMLVAAMNPCPCGYFGEGNRCRCSSSEVARYQKKISGPILDRIDLQVDLKPLTADERFSDVDLELGAQYRKRVILARNRQDKRFAGTSIPFNAAIPGGSVREYCEFSPDGFDAYRKTIDESVISTRSMDRLAKVSRTIADLYNQDQVLPQHVQLGASYVLGGSLRAVFQG